MNLRVRLQGLKTFAGAQPDIDRIVAIWRECLTTYGGPYLFGPLSLADAMYAPVCTRFLTYDVKLDDLCAAYCQSIMAWPAMQHWVAAAEAEPEEMEELDIEF
jgi:glutathione S-transferase